MLTVEATEYIRRALGPREPKLDAILREALLHRRLPAIQVDDNAGRVLQLLVSLKQPRLALEIGTLFGYSAIHIAQGLPPGGRLVTFEWDGQLAEVARDNIKAAGVEKLVDVVEGDAIASLAAYEAHSVDFIFIDGNKSSYPSFLRVAFPLLAPGGLLVADDAWPYADYSAESEDGTGEAEAAAIKAYTRAVCRSPRLRSAFIGTGHGLLVSQLRD